MASQTHKINMQFSNMRTTPTLTGTIEMLNELQDGNNHKNNNKYGDYSKSRILVSKPHGFHENDDSKSNASSDENEETNPRLCLCTLISDHLPILHPFGPFRCLWDFLVVAMLIYTCIEVPVTLAFNIKMELTHFSGIIALIIDLSLLIDILITFRTAYFDRFDRLRLIIDECEIAKRYIFGWFFIDLLTSIPFEFIILGSNIIKFVKIFRIFRFVRIIKILRLLKMIKYFDGFMSQFVIRELLTVLKFLKIFALMLLFAHLAACAWFFVGYSTLNSEKIAPNKSWVFVQFGTDETAVIDAMPTFHKYSYSWYWAVVTLFTTGYGDIVATKGNLAEQWTVSVCILVGTCFFAYFIGTLTSLITEGDRIKSVEIQKLEEAQAFCDRKKLPRELSRAVLTHIRYHCDYNYVFDESELIQSLPPYLQNDIHSYLAQTILIQLDFFKQFEKNLQVLGQISLKMRSISCNENYCLFQRGDRAKEIYIQRTGESLIDYHDGSQHVLKRGDVIGERSILSPKRKTTVKCNIYSEFYVLCVQDIVQILQTEYPTTWTKRWRKMVKHLKMAIKNDKKYVRTVDFNKFKEGQSISDETHEQMQKEIEGHTNTPKMSAMARVSSVMHTASASRNGLHSWISQPSTINTHSKKIKSVQLNGNGEVDTPRKSQLKGTKVVEVASKIEVIKEQSNKPTIAMFAKSVNSFAKSDPQIVDIATNNTNNNGFAQRANRAKSMQALPSLQNQSVSSPVHKPQQTKAHKSHKHMFGIFVKRNSLDRDDAIHRNAKKRGAITQTQTMTTKGTTAQSFYDYGNDSASSTRDSSDDSGDIVPHDYDDSGDEESGDLSKTYTNHINGGHTIHGPNINQSPKRDNTDIVSGVDNMTQLFRKVTKYAYGSDTPNNGKFTANDRTLTQMETPEAIAKAQRNMATIQNKSVGRGRNMGGGRKGGKFGGKKRRANMGAKAKKVIVNQVKKSSYKKHTKSKSSKEIKIEQIKAITPVNSHSSMTYSTVDNMIMNDKFAIRVKSVSHTQTHNSANSNSADSTESAQIVYDDDSDVQRKNSKEQKRKSIHVKFKQKIVESAKRDSGDVAIDMAMVDDDSNLNLNAGFVMLSEDYIGNEKSENTTEDIKTTECNRNNSDSTHL